MKDGVQLLILLDGLTKREDKSGFGYTWKRIFDFVKGQDEVVPAEIKTAMGDKSNSKI